MIRVLARDDIGPARHLFRYHERLLVRLAARIDKPDAARPVVGAEQVLHDQLGGAGTVFGTEYLLDETDFVKRFFYRGMDAWMLVAKVGPNDLADKVQKLHSVRQVHVVAFGVTDGQKPRLARRLLHVEIVLFIPLLYLFPVDFSRHYSCLPVPVILSFSSL